MTPATIIREARADGVRLALSSAGTIKAIGDSAAVNRWLASLRAHRAGIIEALKAGAGDAVTCSLWLMHFADRNPAAVIFAPAVDHAGALSAYSAAIAAEPMPEPPAAPVPADLTAKFDACERAGLYDEADRAALPAMLALDAQATRGLIEATHSRLGQCRRCRHFRRPGASDGYCTERADLPHAYGFMQRLPSDEGTRCAAFDEDWVR